MGLSSAWAHPALQTLHFGGVFGEDLAQAALSAEGSQHTELHFTVPCSTYAISTPEPKKKCSKNLSPSPCRSCQQDSSRLGRSLSAAFHGAPSLVLQKLLQEGPLQHTLLPFVRKLLQAVLSECYNSSFLLKVFGVEIRGECPELSKKLKYFSPNPCEELSSHSKTLCLVLVKISNGFLMCVCIPRGVPGILLAFFILFFILIPPPNLIPNKIHYINLKVFLHPLLEEQSE